MGGGEHACKWVPKHNRVELRNFVPKHLSALLSPRRVGACPPAQVTTPEDMFVAEKFLEEAEQAGKQAVAAAA